MRAVLILALLSVAATGCSRIQQNAGYRVDESLVTAIQPGVDNKASVEKTLGRPTFTGEFAADDWYYISRNTTQLAFAAPRAKEQSIIRIRFDARGQCRHRRAARARAGRARLAGGRQDADARPPHQPARGSVRQHRLGRRGRRRQRRRHQHRARRAALIRNAGSARFLGRARRADRLGPPACGIRRSGRRGRCWRWPGARAAATTRRCCASMSSAASPIPRRRCAPR